MNRLARVFSAHPESVRYACEEALPAYASGDRWPDGVSPEQQEEVLHWVERLELPRRYREVLAQCAE